MKSIRWFVIVAFLFALSSTHALGNLQFSAPGFYVEKVVPNYAEVEEIFNSGEYLGSRSDYSITRATQVFFHNNEVFIGQKEGQVRVVVNSKLQAQPVLDISARVNTYIDRGLNGAAVTRSGRHLIVSYSYENYATPVGGMKSVRLSKFPLVRQTLPNGEVLITADEGSEVILAGSLNVTPELNTCDAYPAGSNFMPGATSHAGGNVIPLTDGTIAFTNGDAASFYTTDDCARYSQDLDRMIGKIFRINEDGSAPTDNPFFTGDKWSVRSKVWVYGVRNMTFITQDPFTSQVCATNVGWGNVEGLFCFSKGDNAGWPCEENGWEQFQYSRKIYCPLVVPFVLPEVAYLHEMRMIDGKEASVGAATGIAFPTASEYPQWMRGKTAYVDYVLGWLKLQNIRQEGASSRTLITDTSSMVGLATDAEGYLYVIVHEENGGRKIGGRTVSGIYKLRFDPDAKITPNAVFRIQPTENPRERILDASGSSDPASREITYKWYIGNETLEGKVVRHIFANDGQHKVRLVVQVGDAQAEAEQVLRIVTPPDIPQAEPFIVEDTLFGDNDEFPPSIDVPVEFTLGNNGANAEFMLVVNILDRNGTQVNRAEVERQRIAPGSQKPYAFSWRFSSPGRYTVAIEFYEVTYDDNGIVTFIKAIESSRYPAADVFNITNRTGDDPDGPKNPEPPKEGLPPLSQNGIHHYCLSSMTSTENGWSNFTLDGTKYDCIFQRSPADNPSGNPALGYQKP